ncbi:MAG TPA: thermonuclease family protein [Thermoleophilaceae bacterium]
MSVAPSAVGGAAVERVVDGDTLRLAGVGRVRLIGIDTPEVEGHVEPCGEAASAFVARLLAPGTRVRYRVGVEQRDRYGRLLAYVRLPDGRSLQRLLLERGYARPLTIPPNVERAAAFAAAAQEARAARRGIWASRPCSASVP